MANNDIILAPDRSSINTGLASPPVEFMLGLFGPPGTSKPKDCDNNVLTTRFKAHVFESNVGPFSVEGFSHSVQSLARIFAQIKAHSPESLTHLANDGMLCVRHKRKSMDWSNHAFGCAIDLRYPSDVPKYKDGIPQGDHHTFQGLLDMYSFFHAERWYWGAGYSGDSIDAMHFEPSRELLHDWNNEFGPF